MSFTIWVVIYGFCLSVIAYCAMFWDKFSAIRNSWRLSEGALLGWSFLGGAFGAKIGQKLFRHKTRKEPFRSQLNLMVAWNVVLYLVLLVEPLRTALLSFIVGQ